MVKERGTRLRELAPAARRRDHATKDYFFCHLFSDSLFSLLSVEIAKKALSAAAALSDRSEASPAFMLWTVPTTLLSILGLFYFVSK